MSSNVTTVVGACASAECMVQREQTAAAARERLRLEQERVATMTERRLRAELDASEQARQNERSWRQSYASQPANPTDDWSVGYGYYPIYPRYPSLKPCGGGRCAGVMSRRSQGSGHVRHHGWGVPARVAPLNRP